MTKRKSNPEGNLTYPVRSFIRVTEYNMRCYENGQISTYALLYRILASFTILNEREKADIMQALKANDDEKPPPKK